MNLIVGFSKHKGFAPLSWLIMLVEGTPFSHTYLSFYSSSLDRQLIYQATGSGINFIGEKRFLESNTIVDQMELTLSEEKRTEMLQWCVDETGKPYGKMQLVGLAIKKVFNLFGKSISNPFEDGSKSEICVEAVLRALLAAKVNIQVEDPDSLGLKEIFKLLKENELTNG